MRNIWWKLNVNAHLPVTLFSRHFLLHTVHFKVRQCWGLLMFVSLYFYLWMVGVSGIIGCSWCDGTALDLYCRKYTVLLGNGTQYTFTPCFQYWVWKGKVESYSIITCAWSLSSTHLRFRKFFLVRDLSVVEFVRAICRLWVLIFWRTLLFVKLLYISCIIGSISDEK